MAWADGDPFALFLDLPAALVHKPGDKGTDRIGIGFLNCPVCDLSCSRKGAAREERR